MSALWMIFVALVCAIMLGAILFAGVAYIMVSHEDEGDHPRNRNHYQ